MAPPAQGFGTEADGFQHLKEHVLALKPTVIVVGYGMTDSFAGEAGLPRFKSGMNHLLDVLGETRARVVLLSPIAHEDLGRPLPDPTRHNEALRLYGAAIRAIAAERGALFIDLFELFALTATPGVRARLNVPPNTDDGIHLTAAGYRNLGLAVYLDLMDTRREETTISKTMSMPRGWRFELTNARLPFPRHLDSGQSREPFWLGALGLSGDDLPDGRYTLSIDDQTVARGDVAASRHAFVGFHPSPELVQSERLRQTITAKNRLYFYRWRPQNETYLFGFRKHEQGNNAREIPLFDPLVEEKEKEIARLKVPVKHVYEFIRNGEEAK